MGLLSTASIGELVVRACRPSSLTRFVAYAEQAPDTGGVDLQLAATLRLPGGMLGQFDVGLELVRRDELELVGTAGRIVVPDPWLCRGKAVELVRDGRAEHLPVDPEGAYALRHDDHDVYVLAPVVVAGAAVGRSVVHRLDQTRFELLVILFTVVSSLNLLR